MAVKIRLQRHGRAHRPFYHIVAADSRARRDGLFIEKIGTYDPMPETAVVVVDHEKAFKWLVNGALPTETVRAIFSHEGLMLKLHLHRKGKSAEEIQAAFENWLEGKKQRVATAADKRASVKAADKADRLEAEKLKAQARAEKLAEKLKAEVAVPAEEVTEAAEEAAEVVATEEAADNAAPVEETPAE